MQKKTEILSGYVVDFNCARSWATDELFEKARSHPNECSLHGEAIESGFVLVNYQSGVQLIDHYATPLIVELLQSTRSEIGIQLRIERELQDDEMRSVLVTEV